MKFPRALAPKTHVWRGKVLICVITMPRDHERCDECERSFVQAGFPPPLRIPGEVHLKGQETMHDTITRAHRLVLESFVRAGYHKKWHLLVLEDDARLQYSEPEKRLARALDKLEKIKIWCTLHVGHVPLGPCLPLGWNLCRTTLPYAAHAIMYNRHRFPNINKTQQWGRPWFFEGMLAVPFDERFAMLPSLCGQSVTPKEMQKIPLIKSMSYQQGETFMMILSVVEVCVILVLASYGGIFVAKELLAKKTSGNLNKLRWGPINAKNVELPEITT